MKKIITILLALAMLFTFVACDSVKANKTKTAFKADFGDEDYSWTVILIKR